LLFLLVHISLFESDCISHNSLVFTFLKQPNWDVVQVI